MYYISLKSYLLLYELGGKPPTNGSSHVTLPEEAPRSIYPLILNVKGVHRFQGMQVYLLLLQWPSYTVTHHTVGAT
jgi:hypothetical protein